MTETNGFSCKNCGSKTQGKFCHQCGQKTNIQHRTFKQLVRDFTGEYLTLDNKLFRSLKPLFFKPGQLTVDYIAGKQKSFILPFRLFIFSIILFIFVASVIFPAVQNFLSADGKLRSKLEVVKETTTENDKADEGGTEDEGEKPASQEVEGENDKDVPKANDVIENMILSIQAVMIFMAPFFAFMLRLFYFRVKNFYYVDHLIFSLHFHSFIFILFSFATFFIYTDLIHIIVKLIPVIYLYLALRRVYLGGRILTGFKTIFALLLYAIITFMILALVALIKTFGLDFLNS